MKTRAKSKAMSAQKKVTPEQALRFLEDMRLMQAGKDEPTKAISIRVPGNILRSFKTLAESEGRSYQAMMNEALREYLKGTKHGP